MIMNRRTGARVRPLMLSRLTYSNVMATLAIFVALGGTSYAAAKLTGADIRNSSLTGKDVRNSSLTGKDVRNSSLTGRDIRNGSVAQRDLGPGVLAGVQGERGATGATGATGAKGEKGDKGDTGATSRWLLIDENGDIVEQSGGFTVVSKPGVNGQPTTNPNYYVDAGSSLVGKGITGTIAIQNKIDRTGDGVADPAFNGDVAVGRCNSAAINCVPAGTNTDNTLVVRALANNADSASQTRRVYVHVTS